MWTNSSYLQKKAKKFKRLIKTFFNRMINIFNFTVFASRFNERWHPVSPADVVNDPSFSVKSWSESNYLCNDFKVSVFWREKLLYDVMVTWPHSNWEKGVRSFDNAELWTMLSKIFFSLLCYRSFLNHIPAAKTNYT